MIMLHRKQSACENRTTDNKNVTNRKNEVDFHFVLPVGDVLVVSCECVMRLKTSQVEQVVVPKEKNPYGKLMFEDSVPSSKNTVEQSTDTSDEKTKTR